MVGRMKIGSRHHFDRESQGSQLLNISVPLPRLWMIMVVLAVPFFVNSAIFFESWERSGTAGAIIADMVMPTSIISYLLLLYALKKRSL
jgi:hypothetical protein